MSTDRIAQLCISVMGNVYADIAVIALFLFAVGFSIGRKGIRETLTGRWGR